MWRIDQYYICYTSYFQQIPNFQRVNKPYRIHQHKALQSGLITNTVYDLLT